MVIRNTAVMMLITICLMTITAGCTSASQTTTLPPPQSTLPTQPPGATIISPPASISFEVIAQDSAPMSYRTDKAYCKVFTDPGDLPSLSPLVSRAAGAKLDLDHYMYVAVFHGRKPTTQYYFVAEQATFDQGLVVLALQLKDDGAPGEEETWPYIVLAIAETAQIQEGTTLVVKVDEDELCWMEY